MHCLTRRLPGVVASKEEVTVWAMGDRGGTVSLRTPCPWGPVVARIIGACSALYASSSTGSDAMVAGEYTVVQPLDGKGGSTTTTTVLTHLSQLQPAVIILAAKCRRAYLDASSRHEARMGGRPLSMVTALVASTGRRSVGGGGGGPH